MLETIGFCILVLLFSPFIIAAVLGIGVAVLGTVGVVLAIIVRIIRG